MMLEDVVKFMQLSCVLARTFRNSSGFPAANTTLPNSSMTAFPTSAHTTFAMISNPPCPCADFAGAAPSNGDRPSRPFELVVPPLTPTFSASSMMRLRSRSTKRKMVLYNAARGSSVSSRMCAWASKLASNGFCFETKEEKGVKGVRGGCDAFERAAGGKGVWGTIGLRGALKQPG